MGKKKSNKSKKDKSQSEKVLDNPRSSTAGKIAAATAIGKKKSEISIRKKKK